MWCILHIKSSLLIPLLFWLSTWSSISMCWFKLRGEVFWVCWSESNKEGVSQPFKAVMLKEEGVGVAQTPELIINKVQLSWCEHDTGKERQVCLKCWSTESFFLHTIATRGCLLWPLHSKSYQSQPSEFFTDGISEEKMQNAEFSLISLPTTTRNYLKAWHLWTSQI